jgi:hypothetical protein
MKIAPHAAEEFIALYHRLLYFAGQSRDILPNDMSLAEFIDEPLETKADCRDAIYEPFPLFDEFLAEQGDNLTQLTQAKILDWKRFVRGNFVVLRHLKEHTIFLNTTEPAKAYAVLGLMSDLSEVIPNYALPLFIETVLLPFEGVIVYDGIVLASNVLIGPNMSRGMKEEYKDIKKAKKIVTTL